MFNLCTSVKKSLVAGLSRPHSAVVGGAPRRSLPWLCLLLFMLLCRPEQAWAMLWQWAPGASAGRLILVLDSPDQARSVARVSATDLELRLNSPVVSLRQAGDAPAPDALLRSLALHGGAGDARLRIRLSPAVVNYTLTRPAPDKIALEFFAASDKTGAAPSVAESLAAPVSAQSSRNRENGSLASAAAGHSADALLRRRLNGLHAVPYSRLTELADLPSEASLSHEERAVPDFATPAAEAGFWSSPAFAAAVPENSGPKELGDRGVMLSRQDLRGRINAGGPEAWPETGGLSTTTLPANGDESAASGESTAEARPADASAEGEAGANAPAPTSRSASDVASAVPAQSAPPDALSAASEEKPAAENPAAPAPPVAEQTVAPQASDTGPEASGRVNTRPEGLPVGEKQTEKKENAAEKPREVIYVDEQGNPVPKPPEPDKMLAEAERLIGENKFDEALPQLEKIRALTDITPEMREKALYYISDCLWARYADNPLAGYESIVSSASEAMNANLRSLRVPDALLRLGLANANVGNLVDAGGYIVALFRRYPDYPGVAQGFTALGREQLKRGLNAEAEQSFSIVLDKYPESSYLQTASVGLAQALFNQKKHDKAQIILDFISKRWPRYYIDEPSFLLLQAGNSEILQKTDAALDLYWLYTNLDPGRQGNDEILLKMGDIYLRKGKNAAADFIYRELARRFADSPLASTARLRLVEKGIYDSPLTYEQMSPVFTKGGEPPLWRIYSELAASSKTAPEAVLARLKQAMWLFWDKQYTEAMGKAAEFIDSYPEHPDVPQAREIIWQAFQKELNNSLAEQNYGRILILWNGFPLVRERHGEPDPNLRYALAQGWLERGNEKKAFELLGGFLRSPMDPQYGEAAFTEFFNRYLQAGAWDRIMDLGKLVSSWNMKPQLRKQLDYALALSAQNLNLTGPALVMWRQLAARDDIPLYQQAYATYFLARDAENRKDIKESYELNRKVIDLFTRLQDERSDKADPQRIKEAVAALMDICEVGNRIPEALQWVKRYKTFVPDTSSEYPGLRFREARLYRKLGDANRAQALLEDIVRRFPDSSFAAAASGELRTFEVSRDLQSYMPETTSRQQQSQRRANMPEATPRQQQPGMPEAASNQQQPRQQASTPGATSPQEQPQQRHAAQRESNWSWSMSNQQDPQQQAEQQ
ncbi:tetratricopeptide repeat protein [Desulfovibrio sp. SGI.169]|uniref:tetratricopeptide repeat protein n=1 Tax=Desulfovibrio sp. SGI.169 TaxID=3420561 RepID=UPI003D05B4D6